MLSNYENLHEIYEYEEYTRSYDTRYIAEIRHLGLGTYRLGLGTYRILKDLDNLILDNKIEAQFLKWDVQWEKLENRNKIQADKEINLSIAEERTLEAQKIQNDISTILIHTLSVDDKVDWNNLKNNKKYKVLNPKWQLERELKKIVFPTKPTFRANPIQPNKNNYIPAMSLMDKIFTSRKNKKINHAEQEYQTSMEVWKKGVKEIEIFNLKLQHDYDQRIVEYENQKSITRQKFKELEEEWKKEEFNFYSNQDEHNKKVESLKQQYLTLETNSVIEYCELVLNNSEYPDLFPRDFEIDYIPETKNIVVEYILPAPENIPTLKEVRYIATKKELKENHLSETQVSKIYDNTIYQITLRTLHELFEADQVNAIESIIFNGWVKSKSKATGKQVNSCIVSIHAKKEEFMEIELANVDPKTCFKNLKGIGSSKLSGIVAIQPIIQINRNDKRFTSSYNVADSILEGDNLASMDWEDFEHLLRELFAKEFSSNGGEVKVTQSSRDGGVDAVAFDPDPIRGGKIVIQAKRYTNTVGVAAVRDLYGTVLNEGATKGILVTTSDYGPESYGFAKNKPLTLMNGANLLYLLEKHGHRARIDLAEAKKMKVN